ncbi:MAG TPA: phosphodiesterase [Succinivibrionaceae bacterium]|nr:phosphodiesterase [Succinivibrionaceae bacterium]
MRYLILSDIHGGNDELREALSFFDAFKCDYLVLLGDLLNHGPRNRVPQSYSPMDVAPQLEKFKDKIIAVRGNCDSEVDQMVFSFPCTAPYGWILIPKSDRTIRVMLTHGHLYRYETEAERDKLGLKAGDIVLSGHTHVSGIFRKPSGVINVNPGSTTIPKGGTPAGFAVMDEDGITLCNLNGDTINFLNFNS